VTGSIWGLEVAMGIAKNVAGVEKTGRIVLGVILILLGLFLSGLWQLLFIIAGVSFILTAFVGY
jgi:hypothetical protein